MISVAIVTVSDKGSRGEREDASGQEIRRIVEGIPGQVKGHLIVPDEKEQIKDALTRFAGAVDLILTTGGTGVAPRDVTPEATAEVIEQEVPGFGEIMRVRSFEIAPTSILSRAMAGVSDGTLIINLPGSPKAVRECLELILPAIGHAVELIKGEAGECARE